MHPLLLLLLLLTLAPASRTSDLVLEEGYNVSTVFNFNKKRPSVNPVAILPRSRSGGIIILDSAASAFYYLPLPLSQGKSEISLYAGKGVPGFADGDPTVAMFDKPQSFAIDSRDNVYVADRNNRAIRKISRDGVTSTIAGGYSEKTGHEDGPAQNASFSNNFELVYVPKVCALLISDHGNRLIRQMSLKAEDCTDANEAGLGAVPVSIIAVLCALVGAILGFMVRPFLTTLELSRINRFSGTWKHYQALLRKLIQIAYSDIKSVAAKSTFCTLVFKVVVLGLNYLSVVFRNVRLEKRVECRETVSLLDSDVTSNCIMTNSGAFTDQISELICFDERMIEMDQSRSSPEKEGVVYFAPRGGPRKIDDLITTNLLDFADRATQNDLVEGSTVSSSGPVKRRLRRDDAL